MKAIKINNNIEYHNCVDVLIFNDKGELALQQRSANDISFPGHWDFSAGGHVEPEEKKQKAAEREVFEELGVFGQIVLISQEHFQYPAWKSSILREVDVALYKMNHNGPFKIEHKEVKKIVFFNLPTIQKMIDDGDSFHPEFLLAWKKRLIK